MPVELFTDLERSILDIRGYVSPCIYRSGVLCNNVATSSIHRLAYTARLFRLHYFLQVCKWCDAYWKC